MIKTIARKVYTITWDGTEEEAIQAADFLRKVYLGEGLDSLDLGDTTGAWIEIAESQNEPDMVLVHRGHTMTLSTSWDLFEHEGRI